MKNLKKSLIYLFLFATSLFYLISCNNDNDDNVTKNTIYGIISRDSNYSSLKSAIDKAGLSSTLQQGNITFFAPNNAAFTSFLQASGFTNLDAVPVAALKELLLNHIISTKIARSSFATGYLKTLGKGSASTTSTLSMFIETGIGTGDQSVKVNGIANVMGIQVNASNGVIHYVDKVIGLPTIVTHAIANPNFSTLVQALTRPGNTTNFVNILNDFSPSSPYTVFAPNNAAFTSLLTELGFANLNAIPEPLLDKTLKYHVVQPANILAANLTNNQVVTTLQTSTFTVLLNPTRIKDSQNRIANIVAADVQCANGIIHVLDKVILAP